MSVENKYHTVMQGFCDFLNASTRITALNLKKPVFIHPVRPASGSSVYPANPYIQCPRIFVLGEDEYLKPQACSGGKRFDVTYTLSVFVQIQQPMGPGNHKECVRVTDEVINAFADANLFPIDLQAPSIPGFQLVACMPAQVTYHQDLRHKFEDPRLNVSVSQINFKIEGKVVEG